MLTKTNQADLPNVFDQQKEHDQLNHIKEEIGALAKKLAANGKEVLAQKGFSKEQQDIFEEMFQKCFVSTADTTTKLLPNEETYVFTGDIEAMWLRDSSAQVVHYLPFAKTVPQIGRMIYGLIKRQMRYIGIDPYANACNEEANVIAGRRMIRIQMIGSGSENMRLIRFVIRCGCFMLTMKRHRMRAFFQRKQRRHFAAFWIPGRLSSVMMWILPIISDV